MELLDLLRLALEVALVFVMVIVIWGLLRLRRDVHLSRMALPKTDDYRKMEDSLREAGAEAQRKVQALTDRLESLYQDAERLTSSNGRQATTNTVTEELSAPAAAEPIAESEPEPLRTEPFPRRGPRVLSEAGRAKYDKVLHLAAGGLNVDAIAREVDLTRAEVELMLGTRS